MGKLLFGITQSTGDRRDFATCESIDLTTKKNTSISTLAGKSSEASFDEFLNHHHTQITASEPPGKDI